jgi:hypothetical protein
MVASIALPFRVHPATQPTLLLVLLRLQVDAAASGGRIQPKQRPRAMMLAPTRQLRPFSSICPLRLLRVGYHESAGGKLLQLLPGEARSTAPARPGRYDGLVKQAPAGRCIGCNGLYAQTGLCRRFTVAALYSSNCNWHDKHLSRWRILWLMAPSFCERSTERTSVDLKVCQLEDPRPAIRGRWAMGTSRANVGRGRVGRYSVDSTAKRRMTISELVLCECYECVVGLSIFVAAYQCNEEEEESEL